jgi:hypothetical protein
MNIKEASKFFKTLIKETTEKSEIRIYKKFISILSDLEEMNLTKEQLISIEGELQTINIKTIAENRKKYFKQKLINFIKYLILKISIISEGYYTRIVLSLRISIGVTFGVVLSNIKYGIVCGMTIGIIIARALDSKAKNGRQILGRKLI